MNHMGLSKNIGDPKIVISMGKTDDNHWILGHPKRQLPGVLINHANLTAISVGAGERFDGIVNAGDRFAAFGCPLKALANHHHSLISDPFDISWMPHELLENI